MIYNPEQKNECKKKIKLAKLQKLEEQDRYREILDTHKSPDELIVENNLDLLGWNGIVESMKDEIFPPSWEGSEW